MHVCALAAQVAKRTHSVSVQVASAGVGGGMSWDRLHSRGVHVWGRHAEKSGAAAQPETCLRA